MIEFGTKDDDRMPLMKNFSKLLFDFLILLKAYWRRRPEIERWKRKIAEIDENLENKKWTCFSDGRG